MPKGKAFKGFSDTQMKRIAQKLGYTGKIGQFRDFLKSNPALAAMLNVFREYGADEVCGRWCRRRS